MPLTAGQRLGPYEIVAPLGAGGMGEVYKARDTRLERTVAIKVLPPMLAGDPEFKARFEREAKSISALNHPNICTLHDVGDAEGSAFLVMELLEGETLADRLKKGAIPVDQALELASQMADALDKAHRQGIVHRDLKPANVFLLKAVGASGAPHCKLLDFGLAKMGVAAPPGSIETRLLTTPPGGAGQTPAQTAPLTTRGSILGTFQYMSPEQIEGQDADARTDIWGFGCVLYEMLTGKRAFEGKSQASLIASILERQPTPIAELQPLSPPALSRIVRTCLEKNPDNRFHTAHDLWLHLQWIEEGGSAAGLPAPVVAGRKRRNAMVFGAAALVLAALAALGAWALKPAPEVAKVVTRFTYQLPEGVQFTRTGRRSIDISPDGTKIAFIANQRIYLRQMNDLEAQPIRGSDLDPLDLAFSPDGQSIAFFDLGSTGSDVTLKRIDVVGGKAVPVCSTSAPFGIRWEGDRIVFSTGSQILTVPAAGGTPQALVSAEKGGAEQLVQPQVVADGRAIVFTVRSGATDDGKIVVQQPIEGGTRRVLVDGGTDGRVLSTGHLVWVRDNTLYAQVLNLETLALEGGPVTLVEGVRTTAATGGGQLSISDTGTLVFLPGTAGQASDLLWVDRSGRVEPTGAPPQTYTYPRISPDGTKIAANTTDGEMDIWLWDVVRKTPTRLTSGPAFEAYPVWTPDSRFVIFRSGLGTEVDLFRRAADGTGGTDTLSNAPEVQTPMTALKDGRVLMRRTPADTGANGTLEILPAEPGAKPAALFAKQPAPIANADISPDGRWIAYESREGSTRTEIHVRPFPNVDTGHWQISGSGGGRPMWSKSLRDLELFYVSLASTARLIRVAVPTIPVGAAFTFGTPEALLDLTGYQAGSVGRAFDISPDGKRFLMIKTVGADPLGRNSVHVVTHWFEELKARVKGK